MKVQNSGKSVAWERAPAPQDPEVAPTGLERFNGEFPSVE